MVPIVAGLLMGAALGGGIAALQKKDVLQGALMGGIGGALGGAFMPGAAAAGAGAAEGAVAGGVTGGLEGAGAAGFAAPGLSQTATAGAVNAFESQLPGMASSVTGTGGATGIGAMAPMGATGQGLSSLGGSVPTLTSKPFEIGSFLSQNKGALAGGVLGGMMAPNQEPKKADEGNIREFTFNREINPLYGQPGQPYFKDSYTAGDVTPVGEYNKADGGIIALAEGGNPQDYRVPAFTPVAVQDFSAARAVNPAVQAYNQQIMNRANQQYNINPRPLAMQVPGMDRPALGVAPIAPTQYQDVDPGSILKMPSTPNAGIGGLRFDPVTGRYTGTFEAPGNKKTDLEKMREELDALKSERDVYNSTGGGGDGGYAVGGGIGMHFQSPDDGEASANPNSNMVGAHQTVNMAPHYPMQGMYKNYAEGGISHLGDYSDGGRLLKGPGDGVSDDIPAQIGARQPARLADGEFVVPARIVSELGNGSTDAGAKRLYAMMDRVQNNRRKSIGKGRVAVDSKAYKHLPA